MRKFLILFLVPVLFSLASGVALAQAAEATTYGRCMNNDVFSPANRANPAFASQLKLAVRITAPCNFGLVEQYLLHHPPQFNAAQQQAFLQQLLTFVEQNRLDQQDGASNTSGATTSLVSKGVGALVAIALESGSISRTASGNAATATVNAGQVANFLSAGQIKPCNIIEFNCSPGRKLLGALTVSTSYDISQAATSNTNTAAQAALASLVGSDNPVFTGVSVRADFHARKHIADPASLLVPFQDPAFQAAQATYATAYSALATAIVKDTDYQDALQQTLTSLEDTTLTDTDGKVDLLLEALQLKIASIISAKAADSTAFQTYATSEAAFQGARDLAIASVLNKWTMSFEYDYNRLADQPDQSDFKFIYSYRSDPNKDKILQITANGGTTLYNSLLGSSTSRFRSAQAALQMDYTATPSTAAIRANVSGGYYFQYMEANGLLTLPATQLAPGTAIPLPGNASELLNTTGPIHIGQAKVTLSRKSTNISFPLALTFSNRTDLIKATRVGGNFGITYDFSSLFAKK